ncbi:unnamed protein product [Orchesella dallaii]|uniref:Gustatory receptor n=1 Tax=Orchesella dallaii TaxID=48710 RepID=A0ABP1RTK5_9HEXA
MFVVTFLLGHGSCVCVIANYELVSPQLLGVSSMLLLSTTLACGCSTVIASNPNELVNGLNCLALLKRRIDIEFSSYVKNSKSHSNFYWKWTSRGLQLTVVTFAGIIATFPAAMVVMDVDPFTFTFPLLLPAYSGIGFLVLRFILSFLWLFECCRFAAIFYSTLFYMFELQTCYLAALERLPIESRMDVKFFKWYNALRIADQSYKGSMSSMIEILMANGFVIFVVCNVISLNCYHILPIEVYWFAPTLSLLCVFFIYFLLPLAIESSIKSQQLIFTRSSLRKINLETGVCSKWRWIRKQYSALRPVTFHCGSRMALEEGVDRTYFAGVFFRTVDGLLLE